MSSPVQGCGPSLVCYVGVSLVCQKQGDQGRLFAGLRSILPLNDSSNLTP